MSCDLIDIRTCTNLLTRYSDKDNSADLQLIRYFLTENNLIVKIKYRGVDLKCVIDKLSFVDGEVSGTTSPKDFVDTYLLPPMPVIPILGEEEGEEQQLNITVSQS